MRRITLPAVRFPIFAAAFALVVSSARAGAYEDGLAAAYRGDNAAALRLWLPLANQGQAKAQLGLADIYNSGLGVRQDSEEAIRWYSLAASQGNVEAQLKLGTMYDSGSGAPQDYAEALKWYRLAAAQGNAEAQLKLGAMYYSGSGVPRDYAKTVKWYRLSATQGNAEAQLNLGAMYREGKGVASNSMLAHMWFNLAAAQKVLGAAESRDEVAARMTPGQISQAQELARRCEASQYRNCRENQLQSSAQDTTP